MGTCEDDCEFCEKYERECWCDVPWPPPSEVGHEWDCPNCGMHFQTVRMGDATRVFRGSRHDPDRIIWSGSRPPVATT